MPKIVVHVMPKAELLDPQGKATTGALARLGKTEFSEVRIGKRFELTVVGPITDQVREDVADIAENVLSNSVIEDVVAIDYPEGEN